MSVVTPKVPSKGTRDFVRTAYLVNAVRTYCAGHHSGKSNHGWVSEIENGPGVETPRPFRSSCGQFCMRTCWLFTSGYDASSLPSRSSLCMSTPVI